MRASRSHVFEASNGCAMAMFQAAVVNAGILILISAARPQVSTSHSQADLRISC